MSHWNKGWTKLELKPSDEIFWHATTFGNVKKIRESPDGIKPEYGGGANGPGFYVCPRRTDYMKVMAFRNRKEGDPKEMFILKILVQGFYDMTPYFSNGLAGSITDVCDFVGSRWDPSIVGPSEISKPEGGGTTGKGAYDAYKGVNLATPGWDKTKQKQEYAGGKDVKGWKARGKRRDDALSALWNAAKANKAPDGTTGSKKMDLLIQSNGARKAFLYSLEELTFKKHTGPKISVVGARRFYAEAPGQGLTHWFDDDAKVELEEVERLLATVK
jgi:hypothetical protein